MLRKLILLLIVPTLYVPTIAIASPPAPNEQSLLTADAEQRRIIVDQDMAAQKAFMHDNYIINAPSNRILRKNDALALIATGGNAAERFERTIEGHQITGNIGIVMGREKVIPAKGSQLDTQFAAKSLHRQFTNIFLFEDGRWRFLARQASVVTMK